MIFIIYFLLLVTFLGANGNVDNKSKVVKRLWELYEIKRNSLNDKLEASDICAIDFEDDKQRFDFMNDMLIKSTLYCEQFDDDACQNKWNQLESLVIERLNFYDRCEKEFESVARK